MGKQYQKVPVSDLDIGDLISKDNGRTWVDVDDIVYNVATHKYTIILSDTRQNFQAFGNEQVMRRGN